MRETQRLLCLALLASGAAIWSGEPIDATLNARIRKEAFDHSQVMETLHVLTDRFSPRLAGSPTFKAAADWAVDRLSSWGLRNAHLETFSFPHPGWANEHCSIHVEAPYRSHPVVEVLAWTPSTQGTARGAAFLLPVPENPTQAQLTALLEGARQNLNGRIVLVGAPKVLPVLPPRPAPPRLSAKALAHRSAPSFAGMAGRDPAPPETESLDSTQVETQVNAFLRAAGALARIDDAGMANGLIRAFGNPAYDPSTTVPSVLMRHEDYGRIARVLADGLQVELALEVRNRDFPGGVGYNVVAELPGTTRPREVILLGAHLDAWHTATGATDNAASAAVMMEAARILQAVGAHPARTIRVVLWDGEEHGLLGSRAYVARHFGTAEKPGAEFGQVVAYLNMDMGAGQIRGLYLFGPEAGARVLRELTVPFRDLGVHGAIATHKRPGRDWDGPSTDSVAFSAAGLPAIDAVQDGLQYHEATWHTNLDTLERVPEQDVKRSAALLASVAYHLARRPERLPFFAPAELPRRSPDQ